MSRDVSQLVNKSQRALDDGTEKDPIENLRLMCFARGASGIVELGRAFRRIDDDGNKKLSLQEFIKGLNDSGMHCSDDEAETIFQHFEVDENGTIDMSEFLIKLRPPMSESRVHIIGEAFRKLDKAGHGHITIDDLRHVYSVLHHPEYVSGEQSEEDILKTFLGHFEVGAVVDGRVTEEEFYNYYAGISASIDNDCYFDLLMRQTYKL